jgi:hypothetical protein
MHIDIDIDKKTDDILDHGEKEEKIYRQSQEGRLRSAVESVGRI